MTTRKKPDQPPAAPTRAAMDPDVLRAFREHAEAMRRMGAVKVQVVFGDAGDVMCDAEWEASPDPRLTAVGFLSPVRGST